MTPNVRQGCKNDGEMKKHVSQKGLDTFPEKSNLLVQAEFFSQETLGKLPSIKPR